MYVRVTTRRHGRKTYRYGQLAEAYRRPDGQVRHRVIANLGNLAHYRPRDMEKVIAGLQRVFGLKPASGQSEEGAKGAGL